MQGAEGPGRRNIASEPRIDSWLEASYLNRVASAGRDSKGVTMKKALVVLLLLVGIQVVLPLAVPSVALADGCNEKNP
jgi:hypothetical protein